MTTVGELITQTRDALDEPTAAQWSDVQLVRWLNEAGRDLARATRHLKDTADIDLLANTSEYTVPANVVSIEHAYFVPDDGTGRMLPLEAQQYEAMDQVWGQWQNRASGYPSFFTTMGYSPSTVVKLFPAPTDDASLRLVVSRLPAEMATDPIAPGATADVPAIWYDALVDYCESKALRKDRDPRWQEARQEYVNKRDNLINNPDYLAVNREVVPSGNGYVDAWLVEFEDW